MTQYRYKIVPQSTPNVDGEWRTADIEIADDMRWLDIALTVDDLVPPTYFLVAIERVRP